MVPWEERPIEIAHLLNPAFCSLVLRESIASYSNEREQGMPYAIAFLILPLALHRSTRESLPKRVTTQLHEWLDTYPQVKTEFAVRTRRLLPYTREAMIFGIQKEVIALTLGGYLLCPGSSTKPNSWPSNSEPSICLDTGGFLGRWFALTGEASTVFRLWGIRP